MQRTSLEALNRATLARQGLLEPLDLDPVAAVEHLAGLQAQEPAPPFWALAARLGEHFDPAAFAEALRDGRLVRAPWLRATLHTVTAQAFAQQRLALSPMLEATGRSVAKGRGEPDVDTATLLPAARELLDAGPRTFNDLRAELAERFPDTDDRALGYVVRTHLPLAIEATDDRHAYPRDPRFGLGPPPDADVEAGTEALVLSYLRAFGPASAADAQTWSRLAGLAPVLERLHERGELIVFAAVIGKRTLFDLPDAPRPDPETPAPPRVLGAFDQLVLAHDDRSRIADDDTRKALLTSKNLRIPGVLLVDGRLAGRWKLERKGTRQVSAVLTALTKLRKADKTALEREGERLLALLEPEAKTRAVVWVPTR